MPSMQNTHDTEHSPLLDPESQNSTHYGDGASRQRGSEYQSIASLQHTNGSQRGHTGSRSIEDDALPETSSLGRTLTWQSAYFIAISRVVGSGIFATPGSIFQALGSPGLSLLIWLVGTVVAACGLAVSLEYGCMLPRSGGIKVYLEFTYRHPRLLATTLVAINAIVLGFTASNCIIFSQYTLFAFGANEASDGAHKALAVALLSVGTILHAVTPKFGVRLQNGLGWVKIAIIAFMIIAGSYVIVFRPPTEDSVQGLSSPLAWDRLWEHSSWKWNAIATSLFKVFYSYSGLDNVTNVLNEVKDPVRTLRSVSLAALFTSSAMYFLVNIAYFLVVPLSEITESRELIAALFFERVCGGKIGTRVLPLAIALSSAGNVLVMIFAMARLKQEIARQGFLPFAEFLSSTKPFHSPLGGLLINYLPSLFVIILPPSSEVYSFILEVEGYSGQIFGLAVGIGLLWLRYRRPDLKRPYKAWLPAVVLRVVLSVALLAAPFYPPSGGSQGKLYYATYAILGVAILVVSVLYWYIWIVLIPKIKGYKVEEQTVLLDDGTSINKIVHVPQQ